MIHPAHKYRNITTGQEVEVETVYDSGAMEQRVVSYFKLPSFEVFLKPLHVFEKTYKLTKRKKV